MLRPQLEKLLAKAQDAHTKENAVYKKLLKEKANIEKKLRVACERASQSANELAALEKSLSNLPPPDVTGEGAATAGSSKAN